MNSHAPVRTNTFIIRNNIPASVVRWSVPVAMLAPVIVLHTSTSISKVPVDIEEHKVPTFNEWARFPCLLRLLIAAQRKTIKAVIVRDM